LYFLQNTKKQEEGRALRLCHILNAKSKNRGRGRSPLEIDMVLVRGVAFLFLRTGNRTYISYKRERDRDVVALFYSLTRAMLNAFPIPGNGNAFSFSRRGNATWICFLEIEYAI
jgi:hypothetical protein